MTEFSQTFAMPRHNMRSTEEGIMKTYIHVNQHIIKRNSKTGEDNPVLTFKTYRSNDYASELNIKGDCKVVYRPHKPLSCGAKVWIETEGKVEVIR